MNTNIPLAEDQGLPELPASHRGTAGRLWLQAWFWVERAWREFLYLAMPGECVACGREDHSLCPACAAELRRQTAHPFRAEQSADALVGVLGESHLPVIAGGEYRDVLSAAILGFKNHGRTELAGPLSRCLAQVLNHAEPLLAAAGPGRAEQDLEPRPEQQLEPKREREREQEPAPDAMPARGIPAVRNRAFLVPIPSTGSGWRRRGYDPVALLLRTLVGEGRLPEGLEVAHILGSKSKLPWHRHHQKGLGRAARRKNVRNTLKIRPGWRHSIRLSANPCGQSVLVLDDVLTTGSTLREAAKTLERSGYKVCGAVVLASARAPEGSTQITTVARLAQNTFEQKMNKTMQ